VRIEVQPAQNNGAVCKCPFAWHCQQPEKDKQNFDSVPPGKRSADAQRCTNFDLILES